VPESGARLRVILAPSAKLDIRDALQWSLERFGAAAARRYGHLLTQGFHDIAENPKRPGSRQRLDLAPDVLVYHLRSSRNRVNSALGLVRNPRHFVVYRHRETENVIDVIRVLDDRRDLPRHLSEEHLREGSREG